MSESLQQDLPLHMPEAFSEATWSPDKIIAAELGKLSLKEREKVYEDVHGVSDPIQETPKLTDECLKKMEDEINLIQEKFAYEQAKLLSESFVTDRKFRLGFLRAESFDPKKAAARLVKYFTCRLEMFGVEKLSKSITLDDLSDESVSALGGGRIQILPNRDTQGRAVVISFPAFYKYMEDAYKDPFQVLMKPFYYMMSSLADDEETQKKGVVFVSYSMDMPERADENRRKLLWGACVLSQSLPIRSSSFHYCYNSSKVGPFLPVIAYAAGSLLRVRIRAHHGSHSECQYNLMSFGIPMQGFPVAIDGGIQLVNHVKWLERRRKKEEYLSKNPPLEGAVDLPSKTDVLLGRGRPFNFHPGNRLLHEIVENYYEQYNNVPRDGKTRLAQEIVSMVHKYSGHFLKQDVESGMWVELSNIEARNKVNHSFRRKREFDQKAVKKVQRVQAVQLDGKRLKLS